MNHCKHYWKQNHGDPVLFEESREQTNIDLVDSPEHWKQMEGKYVLKRQECRRVKQGKEITLESKVGNEHEDDSHTDGKKQ